MKQFKSSIYGISFFILMVSCGTQKESVATKTPNPFRKENIIPWSIVSFDVKERTPQQRIQMLKDLGYSQYAYGNRPKQQATMLEELQLAKQEKITVSAVWLYINLFKDKPGDLKEHSEQVFKTIEKADLKAQIWVGFYPKYFDNLTDSQSLSEAIKMIAYLSERAKKTGCKIALYNHGGWFGDAENQLKIIKALPKQDIGVVFNFHHAHEHLGTFKEDLKKMLPYLWCVNLNGMKKGGPKIITIGQGNIEKEMLQYILNLGYQGPFGILGHVKGGDAKQILKQNYQGLSCLIFNKIK